MSTQGVRCSNPRGTDALGSVDSRSYAEYGADIRSLLRTRLKFRDPRQLKEEGNNEFQLNKMSFTISVNCEGKTKHGFIWRVVPCMMWLINFTKKKKKCLKLFCLAHNVKTWTKKKKKRKIFSLRDNHQSVENQLESQINMARLLQTKPTEPHCSASDKTCCDKLLQAK